MAILPTMSKKRNCHGWTSEAADFWDLGADVPLRDGPSGLGPPEES